MCCVQLYSGFCHRNPANYRQLHVSLRSCCRVKHISKHRISGHGWKKMYACQRNKGSQSPFQLVVSVVILTGLLLDAIDWLHQTLAQCWVHWRETGVCHWKAYMWLISANFLKRCVCKCHFSSCINFYLDYYLTSTGLVNLTHNCNFINRKNFHS